MKSRSRESPARSPWSATKPNGDSLPTSPGIAGAYAIVVRTTLEDLAGNHINRAFDVDTFDPITRTVATETVTLPMRIR